MNKIETALPYPNQHLRLLSVKEKVGKRCMEPDCRMKPKYESTLEDKEFPPGYYCIDHYPFNM
jgi:hypothetical protein